jgi:serine/threonine protein phosphatase PrpC
MSPKARIPNEHRTFLVNADGLTESTVKEELLDKFAEEEITKPTPNEGLVNVIASGLRKVSFEETKVLVVPVPLNSDFLSRRTELSFLIEPATTIKYNIYISI